MSIVDLAARRRRRRAGGAAVAGLLVVGAGAAGVWGWRSGAVDTRAVEVTGAARSTAEVGAVTDALVGVPLPLVDTDEVAARLSLLPLVLDADVRRSWPSTIEVEVTERQPSAAVPGPDGYLLVDTDAVVVATAAQPPPGLPVITTDLESGGDGLRAALLVLASLPPDLLAQVSATTVATPADIRLVVAGRDVRWGDAEQAEAKARVLSALLAVTEAGSYDVSAPAAPVTRP